MNKVSAACFIIGLLMINFGLCGMGYATNTTDQAQSRLDMFKQAVDRTVPVHIYGKVVDLDGTPIADVDVTLGWADVRSVRGEKGYSGQKHLMTDALGLWNFTIEKPMNASIQAVTKDGYEYIVSEESGRDLIQSIRTTQGTPVVSVLRKRGETTFLLQREEYQLIRVFSPNSQENSLDLLKEKGDNSKAGNYDDLRVAVEYEPTTRKWAVTYSVATNGTDGIIASNNVLFEAPLDDYQKQIVLSGPPWPRHLYMRSRTPAIYSRLDLDHSSWVASETNTGFRISYKAWINPYGNRNLEYEPELEKEWRLYDQLEDDAKTLIRGNKRPTKPDLPKLIKEATEKAAKGNVEKE